MADQLSGKRIDVHYHVGAPPWMEALNKHKLMVPVWKGWSVAKAIEDKDRDGVALSMISTTWPGLWFGNADETRRLARDCNDFAARLRSDHPGRFGIFAAVPMPDVDATLAEIAYAFDRLDVDGIGFLTSYGSKWFGDPAFDPIMDELNRRKALVYVHPTVPDCCQNLIASVPRQIVEFGADTTRVIAQLVFGGQAQKYPDVRIIFSHGGGTMPFLYTRFVNHVRIPSVPQDALLQLKRFYYDTAAVGLAPPMAALRKVAPLSHILFGTDYPFETAADTAQQLRDSGVFDAQEIAGIEYANARSLLSGGAAIS
jgi:6-methylsalicylate decarboxylase